MASLRLQRVRELLKREIGEAIRREFHVNEVGLISVNDVDVAGDVKSAIVFISILGNAEQQKRGFQLLTEHRIRIQGMIGRSVEISVTSVLQTASGKMIFGKVDEQPTRVETSRAMEIAN